MEMKKRASWTEQGVEGIMELAPASGADIPLGQLAACDREFIPISSLGFCSRVGASNGSISQHGCKVAVLTI